MGEQWAHAERWEETKEFQHALLHFAALLPRVLLRYCCVIAASLLRYFALLLRYYRVTALILRYYARLPRYYCVVTLLFKLLPRYYRAVLGTLSTDDEWDDDDE